MYNDDIFDNNIAEDDEIIKFSDVNESNINEYVKEIVKIQLEIEKRQRTYIINFR